MATAVPTIATTTLSRSLEGYLDASYQPDCDFVDGELVKRNLGRYAHSKLQGLIIGWLLTHDLAWETDSVPEQRIRVSPTRIRVCDVAVLRADAPDEDVATVPPLACMELLSPEDRLPRARLVLEDYRRMGVQHIWLIDPDHRCAFLFDADGLRLVETERLEITGTPIYVPLDDLFGALDRKQKDATLTAAPFDLA